MTTATHYAAIQIDTGTVYGVGTSTDAALADARQWIDAASEDTSDLVAVPCTSAAASYVIEHGGQSSARLTVSRSGVCLRSEEE